MRRFGNGLYWMSGYVRANLRAALEYRASFVSEVLAMIANDVMWIVFWVAFYDRYPAVQGWHRAQIITLWAISATSYGLTNALFGNVLRLAGLIVRGELDFFLSLPRPVLLHALISRMSVSALGDVIFGPIAFVCFADPSARDVALFALLCVSSAGILLGFAIAVSSLGFWLNNAEGLTQLATSLLVSLATYPTSIFRGGLKLALFSVVPAAFIGFVPVEILRVQRMSWLCGQLAVSGCLLWLGSALFARGLRHYESGNAWVARV